MSTVMLTTAAVLTTAAIATTTTISWWRMRRALIAERAARRLNEAAIVRDHQAVRDEALDKLRRSLAAEYVLTAAGHVIDRAYAATATNHSTENDRRGERDV